VVKLVLVFVVFPDDGLLFETGSLVVLLSPLLLLLLLFLLEKPLNNPDPGFGVVLALLLKDLTLVLLLADEPDWNKLLNFFVVDVGFFVLISSFFMTELFDEDTTLERLSSEIVRGDNKSVAVDFLVSALMVMM
jgi:hypothetical protein